MKALKALVKPAKWVVGTLRRIPYDYRARVYRAILWLVPAAASAGYIADGTAQTVLVTSALVLGTAGILMAKVNTPVLKFNRVVTPSHFGD